MTPENKELKKLNRSLQRLVKTTNITSKLKKLHDCSAESLKIGCKMSTVLDQDQVGRIPGFIHELLHWKYEKETETVPYTIHEEWMLATETQIMKFISADRRRLAWWRKVCRKQFGK